MFDMEKEINSKEFSLLDKQLRRLSDRFKNHIKDFSSWQAGVIENKKAHRELIKQVGALEE